MKPGRCEVAEKVWRERSRAWGIGLELGEAGCLVLVYYPRARPDCWTSFC